MAVVTMTKLLESGVHFGHQTRRWDPRMKPYIFTERNGIHIIDLQQTTTRIKKAFEAVRRTILANKSILFVGTKKQAQQAIQAEAENCNMFYVNHRWLGGTLTNFATIKISLFRLKKLEKMEVDGTYERLTKKEIAKCNKERQRLERNLGGIKEMKELPGIVFVIDPRKEAIPVREARRMKIPVVAVVDTNCNPETIDYPIPGNDDAIRAISLFTQIISRAVIEADNEIGLEVIDALNEDERDEEVLTQTTSEQDITQETEEAIAEQEGMDEWQALTKQMKEEQQSPRRSMWRSPSDNTEQAEETGPEQSKAIGPDKRSEGDEPPQQPAADRQQSAEIAAPESTGHPQPAQEDEKKPVVARSRRKPKDTKPVDAAPLDKGSQEKKLADKVAADMKQEAAPEAAEQKTSPEQAAAMAPEKPAGPSARSQAATKPKKSAAVSPKPTVETKVEAKVETKVEQSAIAAESTATAGEKKPEIKPDPKPDQKVAAESAASETAADEQKG